RWSQIKRRVKGSVRELAREILSLYAAREQLEGFAFPQDTVWQRELEDTFPYEETPDQLRAIEDVKKDMEKPKPMDRLICGDVGYGKTEVALRAAFKAVDSRFFLSHISLDHLNLTGRHIEPVAPIVLQQKVIPPDAIDLPLDQAPVLSNTMVEMNHVVALFDVGEPGQGEHLPRYAAALVPSSPDQISPSRSKQKSPL
ncbi:transcription-repair coupling factor (superfamily II helicase), partial [Candidatus Hakubella thermalkaliphila]